MRSIALGCGSLSNRRPPPPECDGAYGHHIPFFFEPGSALLHRGAAAFGVFPVLCGCPNPRPPGSSVPLAMGIRPLPCAPP